MDRDYLESLKEQGRRVPTHIHNYTIRKTEDGIFVVDPELVSCRREIVQRMWSVVTETELAQPNKHLWVSLLMYCIDSWFSSVPDLTKKLMHEQLPELGMASLLLVSKTLSDQHFLLPKDFYDEKSERKKLVRWEMNLLRAVQLNANAVTPQRLWLAMCDGNEKSDDYVTGCNWLYKQMAKAPHTWLTQSATTLAERAEAYVMKRKQ